MIRSGIVSVWRLVRKSPQFCPQGPKRRRRKINQKAGYRLPQSHQRMLDTRVREFLLRCMRRTPCTHLFKQPLAHAEDALQLNSDHYRKLYTSFSLFMVLYLPELTQENAPVGDDLMEWLNVHFIEPSTEEGDHLSGLDRPWEDESFWPYVTRSIIIMIHAIACSDSNRATIRGLTKAVVFFLEVLARHPSEYLQRFAERLIPLMGSQPRMVNFISEKDFVYASRRWNDKVKAIRLDMDHVPKDKRSDGFENWWSRLGDIVGVLEGRGDVIQRVCEELGANWKEVVAAWCIFVEPRMRRHGLPSVHLLLPQIAL